MDANGNELLAQNADEPFVPASVTKIFEEQGSSLDRTIVRDFCCITG